MNKQQFLILLEKYVAKKTTPEEENLLIEYYESFQESIEWNDALGSENQTKQRIFDKIEDHLHTEHNKVKDIQDKKSILKPILKYAAVFIVIIGGLYFYKSNTSSQNTITIDKNNAIHEEIVLVLENGNTEVLSENGKQKIIDANGNLIGLQDGNKIEYSKNRQIDKLVYNELSVPFGKRFNLVLSDGTKIKLNSGSIIRYPIQFIEGKKRYVSIQGEAYFDVVKDTAHPFVVSANQVDIRVLGTQFNVSHYKEDNSIHTVLVEGAVELLKTNTTTNNTPQETYKLSPGQKGSWDKTQYKMEVKKVDTHLYTAWTEGKLIFKKSSFDNIKQKLERHFNVSIKNQYAFLDNQVYSASFDGESLEEILEIFSEDTPFAFKREGNKITITN